MGEPFGMLAIAVTVIEVALIVSVMLSGGPEKAGLPRDTVFAAIMICGCGIVGLCLLVGGLRHHVQDFQLQGASAALAIFCALSVLTLVLPSFTSTVVGPVLSTSQLIFVSVISLVLYVTLVSVQTIRHRDYFLPFTPAAGAGAQEERRRAACAAADQRRGVDRARFPAVVADSRGRADQAAFAGGRGGRGRARAVVGVIIAALVLLPEVSRLCAPHV